MKKSAILIMASLIAFFFSTVIFAADTQQDTGSGSVEKSPGAMQSEGRVMTHPRASKIIGLEVKSNDDRKLGKVSDLIIGDEGNIDYLIISQGGVLGVGDKLTAIPWKSADVRFHENSLLVGLNKERFDSAPTFASWQEFEQGDYEQQVRAYYGEESGGQGAGSGKAQPGMRPGSGESGITGSETESGAGKEGQY